MPQAATSPAQGRIVEEPGNGRLQVFPLPTDAATLEAILREIFTDHWQEIVFGSLIQGAVFELRASNPPAKIAMLDGYLTVDFGASHLHICIGEHLGAPGDPVEPGVATHRRTARAELYRRLGPSDRPVSWGLQLFNGHDEQQLTVFLPNPLLDENGQNREPNWSALALWDGLRRRYLGLDSDPHDRTASRFVHDA
jgi:hypothetical protein